MTAVKRPQMERALDSAPADIRLFLLYGPDESASRELAGRIARSLGADAERMDFTGPQLKADPAALADAAASFSLFGGRRHIRVEPAGDEILPAVEALMELRSSGNPVVVVAGPLRKDSKLVKLATADTRAMALVSYEPNAGDLAGVASTLARNEGLRLTSEIARRLGAAAGGDRAVLAREIEKLACFLDVTPDRPAEVEQAHLDALGADADEGDQDALVDAVLAGNAARADAEAARLLASGTDANSIVRTFLRALFALAQMRSEVDRGSTPARVVEGHRAIFWMRREIVADQLSRWESDDLATAISRMSGVERTMRSTGSHGALALEAELIALARHAARRR